MILVLQTPWYKLDPKIREMLLVGQVTRNYKWNTLPIDGAELTRGGGKV
ncbi:MAG: hypothetical protein Ct9H90mP20_0730 [Candidatus Neomarinimicrobiota bacterium]|nr:MAG: hypothetical protein Ct9H90mP20_0730 [Candidatus Neomarinimicrobiota bacterium]